MAAAQEEVANTISFILMLYYEAKVSLLPPETGGKWVGDLLLSLIMGQKPRTGSKRWDGPSAGDKKLTPSETAKRAEDSARFAVLAIGVHRLIR